MKDKNINKYFSDGLKLVNKNIRIFLLLTALQTVSYLVDQYFNKNFITLLVYYAVLLFNLAYVFSTPLFYFEALTNNRLSNNFIKTTTLNNIKRLVLPIISVFILIFIFTIITMIVMAITVKGDSQQIKTILDSIINFIKSPNGRIAFATLSVISGLLTFQSIYFSYEKSGLIASYIKSIFFSFKRLGFVWRVVAIYFLINIFTAFIPFEVLHKYILFSTIFNGYVSQIIIAASLLYYLENKK